MSEGDPHDQSEALEETGSPPWLRVGIADLQGLDFEAPIAGSASAEARELSDQFLAQTRNPESPEETLDTSAARVFLMLASVTGMHFRPEDKHEPFAPMIMWNDGRRSAALADFRGEPIAIIADLARRANNPVLKGRLADAAWTLDRKQGDLARAALSSYVQVIREVDAGSLFFHAEDRGALTYDARDLLRRALRIARATGWDKQEAIEARTLAIHLREKAIKERALVPAHWFSDLDLDFGLSLPGDVAAGLETILGDLPAGSSVHSVTELWQLTARAYHDASRQEAQHRCMSEAAERMAAEAEGAFSNNSAILASHWMSAAIKQLHGIPDKRDRRTQLRHRLIDMQAGITEEMQSFSQEMNLRELAEGIQKMVEPLDLLEKLLVFAGLSQSPSPDGLVAEAKELIAKHPLSSLFGTSHHDSEGKVIHRTTGGDVGRDNSGVIRQQVAQIESIRRKVEATGQIEIARQVIVDGHYISDDIFYWLLRHSVFVPHDMLGTFSRGFVRFLQGDFVSATYTLVPLLENSLRHVLKVRGHDVTIFDDATQTQQDRTISALFEQMRPELEEIFGASTIADIENVFLTPFGPRLRHVVAHGLLSDGGPYGADAVYGCWLIFRLCMVPLFRQREKLAFPFAA